MLENKRVYEFLAEVNRQLDDVRGRMSSRQPLPFVRKNFSEVRQEDHRSIVMLGVVSPSSNISPLALGYLGLGNSYEKLALKVGMYRLKVNE